jgi:phosphopantothenoylcysteine decarboxylase/phosphopantothenate--cysteine ligase
VAHVSLAEKADVMLVAPASANIIAKLAYGIADDMLSTTALAMKNKIIISPAMNVNMFHNQVVQDNLKKLEEYGKIIIPPDKGYLACGTIGEGKMPSEETLINYILREIACHKDMSGKKVLVTAGPTREAIDPVRFISNHSTGKMGYAIARQAMLRGADVTLVTGQVSITPPPFVNLVKVISADDMFKAVIERYMEQDIIIKTAAVADYTPANISDEKIKKKDGDMSISLQRTKDILAWLGANKRAGQVLCGFSMETENVLEYSKKKLETKKADMIAANCLRDEGAGFGTDTNHLMLIKNSGKEDNDAEIIDLPLMSKDEAANKLLDELCKL